MTRFILFAVSAAALSACSTTGVLGGSSAPAVSASDLEPQRIAQCGAIGAPKADIDYPRGWSARLQRTAAPPPQDELLGGVDEPESDRDTQPLSPPQPAYPAAAREAQVEGVCETLFDATRDGAPVNVEAACSSPVFVDAAEDAIRAVRVPPRMEAGRRVGRDGILYPIKFCLG